MSQNIASGSKRAHPGLRRTALVWLICGVAFTSACQKDKDEPATASSVAPATDVIGRVLKFGKGGGSEAYRTSGWSNTEKEFTWTTGNSAALALPVSLGESALTLRMKLQGMINPPAVLSQPVEVAVNGQKVGNWEVGEAADFRVTIPAEIVKAGSGSINVELKLPKAFTPKSVGQGDDPRVLGVACWELQVVKSE